MLHCSEVARVVQADPMSPAYEQIADWQNLLRAFHLAARGKRGSVATASFERRLADNLLTLQDDLLQSRYQPGAYVHFFIEEPKRRKISAAPFRDRVLHHALCNVIVPRFEPRFIDNSFANRVGKGTHRAADRLQQLARRHRHVLRCDIVKHFPSIDHALLLATLARRIPEPDVMDLIARILASGDGVLEDQYEMRWFDGDDLLAACRPRGLPIGNLTSQFWSNCYLHPFDEFVRRELRCDAYVRYVDDFAVFADDPKVLWAWKRAIIDRLARMRLVIHESVAQVQPVVTGIPWLGFIVFPSHRMLKARKAREGTQRIGERLDAYRAGRITFGEFDASVQGWINHVRFGDTWGLRRHVLKDIRFVRRSP